MFHRQTIFFCPLYGYAQLKKGEEKKKMTLVARNALLILFALSIIHENEASIPFLQAITSALGTIPFTAGPMTNGLVGAKLAVGTKLLYYLGFFGRRRSKSRPKSAPQKLPARGMFPGGSHFPGGIQTVPLPYAFGTGGFPQFGTAGFPQTGGFGANPNIFAQYPYVYDTAQMFQMLAAQGIDPVAVMQTMGGGIGSQAVPASQFPQSGIPTSSLGSGNAKENIGEIKTDQTTGGTQSEGSDDVESFFTFLRDMDDNTCISRLICDIGADPLFLGEFSENIHGIISSLDESPSSGAFQYIAIMKAGRNEGGCSARFPKCNDAAYDIVKNVAPSVGLPPNVNSELVNL